MSLSYKDSGVDIEAGYEAVKRITKKVKSTFDGQVLDNFGSFGAMFCPDFSGYRDPILVSSTDGVGTKLLLAIESGNHDTIGQDLVAMCVNDIIALGAKPLFMLDYIALNKLDPLLVEKIVASICEGCLQAGCALIGGETAEMRDVYKKGDYDLAGFVVGVVDRQQAITAENVSIGDTIIGVPSTGLHSNGFSLARKIIDLASEKNRKQLVEKALIPTKIYVKEILELCRTYDIHGIANITGGGLRENLERVLKANQDAIIDTSSWEKLSIFEELQNLGEVSDQEMYKTFNMGVGMAIIADSTTADLILKSKPEYFKIGQITQGTKKVILQGVDA